MCLVYKPPLCISFFSVESSSGKRAAEAAELFDVCGQLCAVVARAVYNLGLQCRVCIHLKLQMEIWREEIETMRIEMIKLHDMGPGSPIRTPPTCQDIFSEHRHPATDYEGEKQIQVELIVRIT